MKNLSFLLTLVCLCLAGSSLSAQTKKPEPKKTAAAKKSPTPQKKSATIAKAAPKKSPASTAKKSPANSTQKASVKTVVKKPNAAAKAKPATEKKDDKSDLEKALAIEKPDEKITALMKFLADHPKSNLRPRVFESLTAARVVLAETRFETGEREAAVALYRAAIKEAPLPYPERLFNEVISKVPQALFFRGETAAARETASAIASNSAASSTQLLAIAGSYLMMENGDEAKRLAEAALKLDERSSAAHLVLGMTHRLNFDLESSAAAFARALELDPASATARRNLGEIKRALGKPDEALALFDELLAKDPEDFGAGNGRILSLFAAGKRSVAETELAKAIEANSSNVPLIAGAAYWYAANGDSTKAIDMAGKAIAADPRYIWSHIALSRAFLIEGRFADAEQTLLKAKKYGNFPTLEYEIASTRIAGGFYREAAEELARSFVVKDGVITTKLGRRVDRSGKSFIDLLSSERTASILEPASADNAQNAETLKALLELKTILSEPEPDTSRVVEIVDTFVKGGDKMRFHRQMYAANELLEKKVAIGKAVDLSKAAVASVEDGLNVPSPAAAIMAVELYPNRVAAINSDRYVIVPEVPKATLSAIARGRIEEIAGWSLLQQGSNSDAVVRLRRAVSILPEKSSWWRSSYWRLGQALEADGKEKEAVEAYVKSYMAGDADGAKYAAIETIYKKANGDTEGLEALIGANPVVSIEKKPEEKPAVSEAKTEEKAVENVPASATGVKSEEKPPEIVKEGEKSLPVTDAKPDEEPKINIPAATPETKNKETDPEPKKPLFDPVVIEVKGNDLKKTDAENTANDLKKEPESKIDPGKPDGEEVKVSIPPNGRPRVIEGKEIKTDGTPVCAISVSQESVSLIGGGGSVGILVGIDNGLDVKQITASSSSPKDIEVVTDAEMTPGSSRMLFVIKSLTPATGVYQVTFSAPCGKKELAVKVR